MPVNSFTDYPMSWKPNLDNVGKTPIYIHLSDLLKADILNGVLTPGTKLPPQRELADYLDINLSTVTRAFKLCEQRGLLCSVVGRGTFVSSDAAVQSNLSFKIEPGEYIQMGAILPNPDISEIATTYLKEMSGEPDFYKLLQYGSTNYDALQIKAAKKWFSYFGMTCEKENILFSSGSQNAIFASLSALFKAGDKIAAMPLTYPGLKLAALSLGIQVFPLQLTDGRLTKESLEYAVKNQGVKGFYLISDFNNPSADLFEIETRKEIAAFCAKNKLPFIEDGIYTLFMQNPLPPITSFCPDYGILIASVSKIMSPGLRLAVVRVPEAFYQAVATAIYTTIITPPALMMQLFTRLVNSGRFDAIRKLRIEDLVNRRRLFDEICENVTAMGSTYCPIRWLLLPHTKKTPTQVENELLTLGVQVFASDRFVVGNSDVTNALRISLISEHDIDKYQEGLRILKRYTMDLVPLVDE